MTAKIGRQIPDADLLMILPSAFGKRLDARKKLLITSMRGEKLLLSDRRIVQGEQVRAVRFRARTKVIREINEPVQ